VGVGENKVQCRVTRSLRRVLLAVGVAVGGLGCGSSLTEPEIITLFVAPQTVECVGVGPRTCLQVRESPDEEWHNFFEGVDGFEFEPGFYYELRVARYRVENPPADASSFRYVLLEVVSKDSA